MKHLSQSMLSASLDHALSGSALAHVERHLEGCPECRARRAKLGRLDGILRQLISYEPRQETFREAEREICEQIRADMAGAPSPEPASASVREPEVPVRAAEAVRVSAAPGRPAGARAAALFLAVIAIGAIVWRLTLLAPPRTAEKLAVAPANLEPTGSPVVTRTVEPEPESAPAVRAPAPVLRVQTPPAPPVRKAAEPAPAIARPASKPAPVVVEPPRPAAVEPPHPVAVVTPPPVVIVPKPQSATPPAPVSAGEGGSERWPLICGIVRDESGAPIAGARVLFADLDVRARTDVRGRFCVSAPVGERTLTVSAQGFAQRRVIVQVADGDPDLPITLATAP